MFVNGDSYSAMKAYSDVVGPSGCFWVELREQKQCRKEGKLLPIAAGMG